MTKFLVIGSGFSGAVVARQLVESLECEVEVWEKKEHIAGNCHTERDPDTGIMVHKYGPHIFNTDNREVWNFVNRFGEFQIFVNRVKAVTARGVFSLPINLLTINQFFEKSMSPCEARDFVSGLGEKSIEEPQNFEEQGLKMVGRDLYETFFKGYTIKQWGCDPTELPASVLKRLPLRFSYDDNYYNKRHQGIPTDGYTEVIRRILDHSHITLKVNKSYHSESDRTLNIGFDHIFYTGPIDAFFNYKYGRLGYRTVTFERIETESDDFQGNAVINYPDLSVPWTRIHEHKHFTPWETHAKTVAFREYSKETRPDDLPYYPKRLAADKEILRLYRSKASDLATAVRLSNAGRDLAPTTAVSFLGRLATYRYMDMEAVIGEAITFADLFARSWKMQTLPPVFPNEES
jgi:UDP-galactopyranose mutase